MSSESIAARSALHVDLASGGLSHRQIAAMTGASKTTVQSDLARARDPLRKRRDNERARDYRATHREAIRTQHRAYYAANRDQMQARYASYRASHREAVNSYSAAHKRANAERINAYNAAYRRANPEVGRVHSLKRRALKAVNGAFVISARDQRRLGHGPCAYCGGPGPFHWDHVIPLARGGRHAIGNLVTACAGCNRHKGARLLVEWRQRPR